jgi:hypothetical protein
VRQRPQVENQILTLRAAMKRWRHYSGAAEQAADNSPK